MTDATATRARAHLSDEQIVAIIYDDFLNADGGYVCDYHGDIISRAIRKVVDAELAAQKWQPIATAPRDGTVVMLFARSARAVASVICIGWWIESMGWLELAFGPNHAVGIVPSHWMPLPEFPEAQ